MQTESEKNLLQKAVVRLRDVFDRVEVLGEPKPHARTANGRTLEDACIEVRERSGRVTRFAVAIRGGTSQDLSMLTLLHKQGLNRSQGQPLLCLEHVSLDRAEALREDGVSFVDASGNMFIETPGSYVYVAGRRKTAAGAGRGHDRVFQAAGMKLILALLRDPEAVNLPQRKLAALAGVAHGGVWEQLEGLRRLGFLVRVTKERDRLVDAGNLLWKWLDRYAEKLRPKLLMGRCLGKGSVEELVRAVERNAGNGPGDGPYAGGEFVAAGLYPQEIHPATVAVYLPLPGKADAAARMDFMKQYGLVPKKDGNVFLFRDCCPAAREPENPHRAADVLLLAELTVLDDPRLQGLRDRMLERVRQRLEA